MDDGSGFYPIGCPAILRMRIAPLFQMLWVRWDIQPWKKSLEQKRHRQLRNGPDASTATNIQRRGRAIYISEGGN
jgi:hypothetical protein